MEPTKKPSERLIPIEQIGNLYPEHDRNLVKLAKGFFSDFSADYVAKMVNECYWNYVATEDYSELTPEHKQNIAYTLHHLAEFLHKMQNTIPKQNILISEQNERQTA